MMHLEKPVLFDKNVWLLFICMVTYYLSVYFHPWQPTVTSSQQGTCSNSEEDVLQEEEENGNEAALEGQVDYMGTLVGRSSGSPSGVRPPPQLPPKQKHRNGDVAVNGAVPFNRKDLPPPPAVPPRSHRKPPEKEKEKVKTPPVPVSGHVPAVSERFL